MLERFSQLAEQAAMNVSRRAFLGRIGAGAVSASTMVGAVLAMSNLSHAGRRFCGTDSVFACAGMEVGTPCPLGGGEIGRCSRVQGSSGCLCQSNKPVKDHLTADAS